MLINKEFVVQEVLDTIALKQLNNEKLPELSGDRIDAIADSIIFDWKYNHEPEANFEECVTWNINQHIEHWNG